MSVLDKQIKKALGREEKPFEVLGKGGVNVPVKVKQIDEEYVPTAKDIKQCKKLAKKGNANAQFILGICYYQGKGVEQDYKQAVQWVRKAAEQGVADAQFNLGVCYEQGKGVEKDYKQAVQWYRKAAEQGVAQAQSNLGVCYEQGQGVEKDDKQVVQWFSKAAEQGVADAQFNLGVCYEQGKGVEQDYKQAVQWFRKAAEQGVAQAQFNLGVCYYQGKGVEQDDKQAVQWYRKAAEQGVAQAQSNLGGCYYQGQGVEKDDKQAVQWFRKAAEQGLVQAQFILGFCYAEGQGVEQDYKQAFEWYRKAAEQGFAQAQFNLGVCYYQGKGVEKDTEKAIKYLKKAATQENINTEIILAYLCPEEKDTFLCKVSVKLVSKKEHLSLEKDDEFAQDIIHFLKNQQFSPAKVILAICYKRGFFFEENHQKYQKLIQDTEAENDIVAIYLTADDAFEAGNNQKAKENFSKLLDRFKKQDQLFDRFAPQKADTTQTEKKEQPYTHAAKQWLTLLAQNKLQTITEQEAKAELEDTMAMFAHKFRGPLQSLHYHAEHQNNPKTHLRNIQTMRNLLDIFSLVSADSDTLKDQLHTQEHDLNYPLSNLIADAMQFVLTQLLAENYMRRIPQHYLAYLKRTQQLPTDQDDSELIENDIYLHARDQLQRQWQADFIALTTEAPPTLATIQTWLNDNLIPLTIQGLDTHPLTLAQYSNKATLLSILFTELLLNAFKYYFGKNNTPITLTLTQQDVFYVLTITNPSKAKVVSIGSKKGHKFIRGLMRKIAGQFSAELGDNKCYSATIKIPLTLLTGNTQ